MDKKDLRKEKQTENDSYKRNLNRLQKKTLDLKIQHQRNIDYLNNLIQQCTKNEDNIFKKLNDELEKFL
jgi:hypothetical protein